MRLQGKTAPISGHRRARSCGGRAKARPIVVCGELAAVVQICHTRWECAVVPPVFARDHNCGSSGGVC